MMKLYVIGIDGAAWKMIQPLAAAGKLPNIARVMREGAVGRLISTVPPLSPVAWTTITTGAAPSAHGIIDFLGYDKLSRQSIIFDAACRRVDPVWTVAGKIGRRCCVVNVPLTYPADTINGFMISGLGTPPVTEGMAYPLAEFKEMKRAVGGYAVDIDLKEDHDDEKIAESLRQVMSGRQKCFDFLLDREPWDLFFFVFTNTDRAQHFFWHKHEAGDGPLAGIITESYQGADRAVGKVMAKAEAEGGVVMIVSDHGFGPLKNCFSLSSWLRTKDLLTSSGRPTHDNPLKRVMRKYIPVRLIKFLIRNVFKARWKFTGYSAEIHQWLDWEKTKIYSHKRRDTVFLFTNDSVFANPEERTACIAGLKKELLAVKDPATGGQIVLDVLDGKEVFGSDGQAVPDLVLVPADGYTFSFDRCDAERDEPFLGIPRLWSGNHEPEGVFMSWGKHVRVGQDCGTLSIMDAFPTMCCIMDIPIPWWAEGRVIRQAFDKSFLMNYKEQREDVPEVGIQDGVLSGAMSAAESDAVANRLKALGYL